MNEAEYLMKNYGDRGGCYPSKPKADLFNSSYPTQPHSLINCQIFRREIRYLSECIQSAASGEASFPPISTVY